MYKNIMLGLAMVLMTISFFIPASISAKGNQPKQPLPVTDNWSKIPNIINLERNRTLNEDPSDPDYPPAGNFAFDGSNDVLYDNPAVITGFEIEGLRWAVPCDALAWNGVEKQVSCILKKFGNYYNVRQFSWDDEVYMVFVANGVVELKHDKANGYYRLVVKPYDPEGIDIGQLEMILEKSGVEKGLKAANLRFTPQK